MRQRAEPRADGNGRLATLPDIGTIQAIVDNGFKMEVDSLLTKRISFITEEYIPKKLRDADYLQ